MNVSLLSSVPCSARILVRIVMGLGVRSELFCKASAGLFVGTIRVGRFWIRSAAGSLLSLLSVESMSGDHPLPVLAQG